MAKDLDTLGGEGGRVEVDHLQFQHVLSSHHFTIRRTRKKSIKSTYHDETVGQYGRIMPQKQLRLCPSPTNNGTATANAVE
jgi:hypothetical protein